MIKLKDSVKVAIRSIALSIVVSALWTCITMEISPLADMIRILGIDLSAYRPYVKISYPLLIPYGKGFVALISVALISGLIPGAIHYRRKWRELIILREEMYSLMRSLSGIIRTGVGLGMALDTLLTITRPPMSDRLKLFSSLISLGYSADEAFRNAFGDLPRDMRSILYTIVIALQSGGRAPEIIDYAASFTADMRAFEELREGRLSQYVYIVIMACIAFAISAVVMLKMLETIVKTGAGILGIAFLDIEFFHSLYFYASLIIVLFSSMTIGRALKGYTPIALFYALIMSIIVSLIFLVMPVFVKF